MLVKARAESALYHRSGSILCDRNTFMGTVSMDCMRESLLENSSNSKTSLGTSSVESVRPRRSHPDLLPDRNVSGSLGSRTEANTSVPMRRLSLVVQNSSGIGGRNLRRLRKILVHNHLYGACVLYRVVLHAPIDHYGSYCMSEWSKQDFQRVTCALDVVLPE
jgi:hypothetical protein